MIENFLKTALFATVTASLPLAAHADSIVRNDSESSLETADAWVENVAPGSEDIAAWDSGSNTTNSLSGSVSWSGINIDDPTDAVSISGGTINLGADGIQLQGADATITSTLKMDVSQVWTLDSGQTLTVSGTNNNNADFSNVTFSGGNINFGVSIKGGIFQNGASFTVGGNGAKASGAITLSDATVSSGLASKDTLTFQGSTLQILDTDYTASNSQNIFIYGSTVTGNGTFVANSDSGSLIFGSATNLTNFTGTIESNKTVAIGTVTGGQSAIFEVNPGGSFQLTGATDIHMGELSGEGTIGRTDGVSTLIVGEKNVASTFVGKITDDKSHGRVTSFAKKGTEKFILSGTLSYYGTTSIDEGNAQIDGRVINTSAISVANGATLSGNTTFANSDDTNKTPAATITVDGTLAPGDGDGQAGAMTFNGAVTLGSDATILFNGFDDTSHDLLTLDGASAILTLSGKLVLNLESAPLEGQVFDLVSITNGASILGNFDSIQINVTGNPIDEFGTFDTATGELTVSQIPEPGTTVFIAAGAALLFFAARRRRSGAMAA